MTDEAMEASLLTQLTEMGFPAALSQRGIQAANPKTLDSVIDWLAQHEDDGEAAATPAPEPSPPAEPLVTDVPPPVPEEQPHMPASDETSTPAEPPKPKLSVEEQQEIIRKRVADNRVRAEQDSRRRELEDERRRREAGKQALADKEKREEVQRRLKRDQLRREKQKDREYKARVLEQIRKDRESRRADRQGPAAPSASPSPSPSPATTPKPAATSTAPRPAATTATLQLRMPSKTVRQQFAASDPLQRVFQFAHAEMGGRGAPRGISFSQMFPRKTFSLADAGKTLAELGLAPSAALVVSCDDSTIKQGDSEWGQSRGVIHVSTSAAYNAEIRKAGGKLVVVDFSASWCGPCQHIAPVYEELAKKYVDAVFLKIDVDEARGMAECQEVHSIPTFWFLKGGARVDQLSGADPSELESKIRRHK
eukprot:gnl/Trimastix_PCT/3103.p1 GENE.gnl/Trimastix_PCT/3103~~gnl/Trimastix_PCT/3103.p1  ORF type:complete len:423 (-),score=118.09 gnl/Trimastix_PCT/3103:50-1318(-)